MTAAKGGWVSGLEGGYRYSQGMERGLAILGCFSGARPVMALAEIARMVKMSQSTAHRYASTLVALGYLEQDGARKYRLSARVRNVGVVALMTTGLPERSHPLLEELSGRTGCTSVVGMLDGTEVVCVDRVRCLRGERPQVEQCLRPGSRLPAYCTAMGKVLLAHLSEKEQQHRIAQMTLRKRAPNTITSRSALGRELSGVLAAGVARNDQESAAGLYAIAAPVRDRTGWVGAALGVVAPVSMTRIEQFAGAVQPHLVASAGQLSALLVGGVQWGGG